MLVTPGRVPGTLVVRNDQKLRLCRLDKREYDHLRDRVMLTGNFVGDITVSRENIRFSACVT